MNAIQVSAEQLKEIRDCIEGRPGRPGIGPYVDGPYSAACEHGFPGFAGGLDYIVDRPWSFDLIDRGMSDGGGDRDNTTKFVVPCVDRQGTPPLADYL